MSETRKILIIDDDELIRMACRNLLQKAGYQTIEATNGNDGVSLFAKENPDLVITDMLMPDKEGLETISEIKALNKNAKIIAISGGGNTKNMTFLGLARKLGAQATLDKPIKPAQLMQAVRILMG